MYKLCENMQNKYAFKLIKKNDFSQGNASLLEEIKVLTKILKNIKLTNYSFLHINTMYRICYNKHTIKKKRPRIGTGIQKNERQKMYL